MSQSDHSVRSLAEILREHGLESEFGTRPGRRRRDDEPKADWPARPEPDQQPPSRLRPAPESAAERTGERPPERSHEGQRAAPREISRDSQRGVKREVLNEAAPEVARDQPARDRRVSDTGRVAPAAGGAPPASPPRYGRRSTDLDLPAGLMAGEMLPASGPSTAAIPALRPAHKPGVPGAAEPARSGSRTAAGHPAAHPLTGPIPVASSTTRAGEDGMTGAGTPTGRESVLAWVRFAGELLLAVAAGVGIYFAFTVLWELMPYVAVVAAPLTVTALVAGVAAWRHRFGQGQLGVRLLAVLLFAGTLLAIVPAAALLAGS